MPSPEFHQAHSNKKQSKFSGRSEILFAHSLGTFYEKDHPRRLDSLDSAYDSIRNAAEVLGGLEIRVERAGLGGAENRRRPPADAREKCRRWRSTCSAPGFTRCPFQRNSM